MAPALSRSAARALRRRIAGRLGVALRTGRHHAARAGGWALRLSGPIAILAAALVLFRPAIIPGAGAPAVVRTATAQRQTATRAPAPGQPAGICIDPAISGCDAYSACAIAVTIASGLAPDPEQTLVLGLHQCAAGAQ